MALATDIILGNDWDLVFANGDILTGGSDLQHLSLITIMDIGHLKESPFLGIGINSQLGGSEAPNVLKANAQAMYEADNYNIKSISAKDGLIINVSAERL